MMDRYKVLFFFDWYQIVELNVCDVSIYRSFVRRIERTGYKTKCRNDIPYFFARFYSGTIIYTSIIIIYSLYKIEF